jgi:hypothetical protein
LLEKSRLSRPILTQYLKELLNEEVIERRVNGEKILYDLTQRGKAIELLGTRLVSTGLLEAGSIVRDPKRAELLLSLARMAKENPDMFQTVMNWSLKVELFLTSDPVLESRWLKVLAGHQDALRPFEEEIKRRTATAQPKTLEDFKAALDDIETGIRLVFEKEKGRKPRK